MDDADDDGFTKPDPIHTDDDVMGDDMEVKLVGEGVKCTNCIHYDICAYYAGVKSMLEDPQTGDGQPPFAAEDLAAICDFFEMDEQ